ncbi:FtsK/SpoIIIE domain-containing protein [Cellulomonas fengjieae]|uniref:FtsK domain-containing protein n=1 Tax=Cellulomonas fengjieae TaxID=2819978 RepID=A0ABS3SDJ6_9CELL|nr:FtsK/SpoIIIE domain-containing protein [Cellulomonas fengjieae]MBO3083815.1 hypothetical protein [Cellulomonas fengjieae]QVI64897.1 hypothetical protein KG102_12115 [Cellulomonas fengjieae]
MRFTLLHPDPSRGPGLHPTDVEADVGIALSALRPALARASGYAGWASAGIRPAVGDVALDEHHVVGQPPLVHGCVLRTGTGAPSEAVLAVRSPWHVAVVAGPDSGGVLAVPAVGTVRLGPPGRTDAPSLTVHDPTLTTVHLRLRGRRVRARVGRGPWRRWRPDRPHRVGRTTLVVRGEPRDRTPHQRAPDEVPSTMARPVTWLAPLLGTVALAAALRQPLLLVAGLAVPLLALGPAAVTRWRRRGRAPADDAVLDLAALAAATAHARVTATAEPILLEPPWDPGGSLAVVGPRDLALPVARAAVLGALGTHLGTRLAVRSLRSKDWAWCVWATAADAPLPRGVEPALVVADQPPDPAALARWRSQAPAAQRVLVLTESVAGVPAWCRARLEVGHRSVRLHDAGGRVEEVPRHGISVQRAEDQVRAAAAVHASVESCGPDVAATLPTQVSLADLDGIPAPGAVAQAWATPRTGLVAALGTGAGGTTSVDLVGDGPHALVAGTTGAGKSELLTTLVLSLALTHPPDRLAILLVDFKGGTGLGPVAVLPHVLEHVTDLDAAHARRVLAALRGELRRRETVLAAAGARDLAELDPAAGAPPRLLVVVDELRALTEDVPDASAALTRIAAQGRALGVHLVLATQRPAGAVAADLRANVALRIALRVTDPADSTDVLDAPDAALLDPTTPGRAWVRRGTRPLEPVQVARAVAGSSGPGVVAARPWCDAVGGWSPTAPPPAADDACAAWLRAADAAARARPTTARPPWLPALPPVVRTGDVPDGPGLALAVADLPDEQRRGAVRWEPADGPLLVVGGPRSGRTTTLVAAGAGALARGWEVHAIGLPAEAVAHLRDVDPDGGLGSVLATEDARAVARLLELVATAQRRRVLVVVDRLDLLLDSLGLLARGAGADRLTALWRGRSGGAALAAAAGPGGAALQHAAAFTHRLVLPLADSALDALAGVPAALAGRRTTPGRAVHVHAAGAELCQVVLPERAAAPRHGPRAAPAPLLVRPLPERSDLPAHLPAGGLLRVPLGQGGDDAETVWADLTEGLLVAGPPGSGRSTALRVVAQGLVRAGVGVVRLTGTGTAPLPGVRDVGPDDVVAACQAGGGDPAAVRAPAAVLLVDDLDDLERAHPELTALLASSSATLVAAVTSGSAAHAFRGPVAAMLRRRRLLVLDVHDPASAELVGPTAAWHVDPRSRPAGRGVLLHGRAAVVVQVYSAS